MIVLDEHLQSKGLEETIRNWYAGAVLSILDLRPDTVIKDEAIPGLLAQQNQPTFVTINVTDFWQRVPASEKFCLACFAVTSLEIIHIPALLRRLMRHSDFDTKAKRTGKVVRITSQGHATFYSITNREPHPIDNF